MQNPVKQICNHMCFYVVSVVSISYVFMINHNKHISLEWQIQFGGKPLPKPMPTDC